MPGFGRYWKTSRGLSLIETLAALLVLSVLAVSALEVQRTGQRGLVAADGEARALSIARNELARAGIEWPLATGSRTGVSDGFRVAVDARPRREQDRLLIRQATVVDAPLVYDVTVRVMWTPVAGGTAREVRLDTIRYAGPKP